ncbi:MULTISPECIES: helix-turn-helix domain-containing protein [unclassified Mycobacterium]|uniref:TetR/AcrR family transcriptional regulator n=1 Tax=unclassified Mycobacterium TaxID=2642494 RepID=UPI0029C94F32|nr:MULTISPECIES: helix-turn-helix domain-containing protein [unclassified Mycobacterium]
MRSHGWSGNAPKSDEEAVRRILDAADHLVAERGAALRLTDVASHLGVTRQTIYRYFRGSEELLVASRMRSADGFIDRLAAHMSGYTEPAAALIESVAYAAEVLGGDRQFEDMLNAPGEGFASLASPTALAFGRSVLHRFDVDWEREGFDDAALSELAELSLRTLHSILIDPGQPPRDGPALRRFVARWLGPAILYPRVVRAMESLQP